MSIAPILPVGSAEATAVAPVATGPLKPPPGGFSRILLDSIATADHKVAAADDMVRAFAVDDSVPLHQVTYALEQARLAVELMSQVRARFVEGYQELMRMQL